MIRVRIKGYLPGPSIPRESGDDPAIEVHNAVTEGYSPRERG